MGKIELIQKMKEHFQGDKERIDHALQVLSYAEQLMEKSDRTYNRQVVTYAAILHDVGIPVALQKYGSAAGPYQEKEGPPIARRIMETMAVPEDIIAEVCEIIAHHHSPGKLQTNNFALLYDADWLVNLPAVYGLNHPQEELEKRIDSIFLTEAGKRLARGEFLG